MQLLQNLQLRKLSAGNNIMPNKCDELHKTIILGALSADVPCDLLRRYGREALLSWLPDGLLGELEEASVIAGMYADNDELGFPTVQEWLSLYSMPTTEWAPWLLSVRHHCDITVSLRS